LIFYKLNDKIRCIVKKEYQGGANMQRCEITGTGLISGNQISHSHRLTRKVCARTLKTLKGASEVEVMRILKANIATLSERLLKHLNK